MKKFFPILALVLCLVTFSRVGAQTTCKNRTEADRLSDLYHTIKVSHEAFSKKLLDTFSEIPAKYKIMTAFSEYESSVENLLINLNSAQNSACKGDQAFENGIENSIFLKRNILSSIKEMETIYNTYLQEKLLNGN